jgi:lysophospholipid acyltransferase (LPLAT)-like uncharacterized protein
MTESNRFGRNVPIFADRPHDVTVLFAGIIIIAQIYLKIILFVAFRRKDGVNVVPIGVLTA